MAAALDAMPVKELIASEIVTESGQACALGAVAKSRGMDVVGIDPDDADVVANKFGIAVSLAREIVYINDEGFNSRVVTGAHGQQYRLRVECPSERWQRVRSWVAAQIAQAG